MTDTIPLGYTLFAVLALPRPRHGAPDAAALEDLRLRASQAIAEGHTTLVISDRLTDAEHAPIPSLLATSAVHHHLVRTKERTRVALVVESGDAREVHHIATLIGFGAAAVNPYLALETIEDLIAKDRAPVYVVHFTQAAALEQAQALMSINVSTKEEKTAIADHIGAFRFSTGFGSTLSRLVS